MRAFARCGVHEPSEGSTRARGAPHAAHPLPPARAMRSRGPRSRNAPAPAPGRASPQARRELELCASTAAGCPHLSRTLAAFESAGVLYVVREAFACDLATLAAAAPGGRLAEAPTAQARPPLPHATTPHGSSPHNRPARRRTSPTPPKPRRR